MKRKFIPIVFFIIVGFSATVFGQLNFDGDSDAFVLEQLSQTCSTNADSAAAEILKRGERMIPLLLAKKGDKNLYYGVFYLNHHEKSELIFIPSNNAKQNERNLKSGELRSMEVAAIFLINAIYHETFEFAQTPNLHYESIEGYPKVGNKEKLIKKAWIAVDKWILQLKAKGMAELRRTENAPLDLERDGVDFY